MNDLGLIIVAAGRGDRLGGTEEKALAPLLGQPLLWWSLKAFEGFQEIVDRVVVVPPGRMDAFRDQVLVPLGIEEVAPAPGHGLQLDVPEPVTEVTLALIPEENIGVVGHTLDDRKQSFVTRLTRMPECDRLASIAAVLN